MSDRKYSARLVLTGHIIDSMILPQVMDMVMDLGGNFTIEELKVGQHKTDTSICRMEVVANSAEELDRIERIVNEQILRNATVDTQVRSTDEAIAAGVFGVPSFVADGNLFWGDDATNMFLNYLRDPLLFEDSEMLRISSLPMGITRPR